MTWVRRPMTRLSQRSGTPHKPLVLYSHTSMPEWGIGRWDAGKDWEGFHLPTGLCWHSGYFPKRKVAEWHTRLFYCLMGVEGRKVLDSLQFGQQLTPADSDQYCWASDTAKKAEYNPQVVLPSWADELASKEDFLILADWLSDAGVEPLADVIRRGVRS